MLFQVLKALHIEVIIHSHFIAIIHFYNEMYFPRSCKYCFKNFILAWQAQKKRFAACFLKRLRSNFLNPLW